MDTTTETTPSTAQLFALAEKLYMRHQELGGYRGEDIPPFAEVHEGRREVWMGIVELAWKEIHQPTDEFDGLVREIDALRGAQGLPAAMGVSPVNRLRDLYDGLILRAKGDSQALKRIEETLGECGFEQDGSYLPNFIAALLSELSDRQQRAEEAAQRIPILTEGDHPAAPQPDAIALRFLDITAEFMRTGGRITVGRSGTDTMIPKLVESLERNTQTLVKVAVDGGLTAKALRELKADLAPCGGPCGGSSAVLDGKNGRCGWADCPHKPADG